MSIRFNIVTFQNKKNGAYDIYDARPTAWDKHRICRRPLARNTICTGAITHLYCLTE